MSLLLFVVDLFSLMNLGGSYAPPLSLFIKFLARLRQKNKKQHKLQMHLIWTLARSSWFCFGGTLGLLPLKICVLFKTIIMMCVCLLVGQFRTSGFAAEHHCFDVHKNETRETNDDWQQIIGGCWWRANCHIVKVTFGFYTIIWRLLKS